jgi:transposase-like protein
MSKSDHPSLPHWGNSLRTLSWDKSDHKTKSQELISSTVREWYDAKHRGVSKEEIKLINSIEVSCCPICGGRDIVRNGTYRNGTRRYLCRYCATSFNPLTNTIFGDKKIPTSEWIEYLLHVFEFHSITSSSRDNRNAFSTGRYWLYKIFLVLKHYQDDILLEGKITLDETFFTVIPSKEKRHRNGLKLKGISRNKLCVVCGKDDKGHILLICENTSKPSHKSTWKALGAHIKEGSTLIHDKERSHSILVEKLHLESIVYDSKEIRKLKDKDNPLDSINEIHSLAKRFMRAHGGYDRDNLQDFMNLISFILNEPYDRYGKADLFINMALNSPIRVKYRDVMSKKQAK